MATLWAIGCAVPLTLPLNEDGTMVVEEVFLCLKLNYRVGTLYIGREVFQANGEVSEIVFVRMSKDET